MTFKPSISLLSVNETSFVDNSFYSPHPLSPCPIPSEFNNSIFHQLHSLPVENRPSECHTSISPQISLSRFQIRKDDRPKSFFLLQFVWWSCWRLWCFWNPNIQKGWEQIKYRKRKAQQERRKRRWNGKELQINLLFWNFPLLLYVYISIHFFVYTPY